MLPFIGGVCCFETKVCNYSEYDIINIGEAYDYNSK